MTCIALMVSAVLFTLTCKREMAGSSEDITPIPSVERLRNAREQTPKTGFQPAALPDQGIWPEFDDLVWLSLQPEIDAAQTSIVVDKKRRVLSLLYQNVPIISYPIALGFAPQGHKVKRGDGRTPEGKYTLCENLDKDLADKYGARSMRLSYPNTADAAAGFQNGLINARERQAIESAIAKGVMPPQDTELGGSLRIHGGGVGKDWTLGCVALRDPDVIDLYSAVRLGTPVLVLGENEEPPYGDADGDGIPNQVDFLLGARKNVLNAADYDGRYVQLSAQGGDVPAEIGVCTDVIIRALRNAGIDLQAEIQRDRAQARASYPGIRSANPSIDHRRVRNLLPYFQRHWVELPTTDGKDLLPGDLVFLDTLPNPGADHIGIISDRVSSRGYPLVINHWTVGWKVEEMNLLPGIPVTHAFRFPK